MKKTNDQMNMKSKFLLTTVTVSLLTNGFSQSVMPQFSRQPSDQKLYVTSNAVFSVVATGSPAPSFQWRFNGTDLPAQTNSTIKLVSVDFSNAGPYSVTVSNAAGSITSQTAWLSVLPTNVVNLGDRELNFGVPTPPIWKAARIDDGGEWVTGNGLTLLYYSKAPGGSGGWDIWISTRTTLSDQWDTGTNAGPVINSAADDADPVLSPDGLSLYFDSNRPGGSGGYDQYVATRATLNDPFGTPVNLGPAINTSRDDGGALVSADNLTLLFTSDRLGSLGALDIWMSTRTNALAPWQPAQHLPTPINSSYYDFPVALSRDGLLLFFKSDRPIAEGPAPAGMYVTRRTSADKPFGPPVLIRSLLGVGAGGVDYSSLSDDGQTFYVGTYQTLYPDWPELLQISISSLPELTSTKGPLGDFQISLSGRRGATYEIQSSPDLQTWSPWLTTNTIGNLKVSEPMISAGRRFYRALSH